MDSAALGTCKNENIVHTVAYWYFKMVEHLIRIKCSRRSTVHTRILLSCFFGSTPPASCLLTLFPLSAPTSSQPSFHISITGLWSLGPQSPSLQPGSTGCGEQQPPTAPPHGKASEESSWRGARCPPSHGISIQAASESSWKCMLF